MTRQSTRMRVILHASMAQGIDMTTDKQIDTPFKQENSEDNLTANTEQTTSDLAEHSPQTENTASTETQISAQQDNTQGPLEVASILAQEDSMDDKTANEKQADDKPSPEELDIGATLKAKRNELGLDPQQAATELKLTIDQVRALEESRFSYFRSLTFARGFLKSYCRLLDIDSKEILAAFDQRQSQGKPSIQPVDKVVQKQSHLGDPIVIFVSVVIIAVLLFFVFWWPSQSSDEAAISDAETPVAEEQVAAEQAVAAEPQSALPVVEDKVEAEEAVSDPATDVAQVAAESESQDAGVTAPVNQSENENVVTGLSPETVALLEEAGVSPDEVVKATQEATQEPVEEPAQPFYLDDIEITFAEDCWTEIRDASGKILFSGVKTAGSELNLTGEAPYRVVFGYSRGVSSLKYKGQAFDFSQFVRQDLARFELK